MADASHQDVTEILREWSGGDRAAPERLMPLVYEELKRQAYRYLSRERSSHTLQPTALVHEAYIKLIDQTRVSWQNRAHFYGVASTVMRRVLIDHARAHASEKRGSGSIRLSLDDIHVPVEERAASLLALDEALQQLAEFDERKAKIVEMRFFAGLTDEEIAEVLGVSTRTVTRDWRNARIWLFRELGGSANEAAG